MSVTSLLDTDEKFREIVKEHLPNRELFRTNTGDKAFSTKYRLLVPKEPLNNQHSCHHERQAPNDELENHLDFALNFF